MIKIRKKKIEEKFIVPIYDEKIEKYFIGAIAMYDEAAKYLMPKLKEDLFYLDQHKACFNVLQAIHKDQKHINLISINDMIKRMNLADETLGVPYFIECTNAVANTQTWLLDQLFDKLKECYVRRILVSQAHEIRTMVSDYIPLDHVTAELNNLREWTIKAMTDGQIANYGDMYEKVLKGMVDIQNGSAPPFLPTHFYNMDRKIRGFMPGNMIVVAGRPGMGKTAYMCSQVHKYAKHGIKCGVFSLEMSSEELIARILGIENKVKPLNILTEIIEREKYMEIASSVWDFKENIFIEDKGGITLETLAIKANYMVNILGAKIIFIDYLQLMSGTKDTDSRENEISSISRGIKALAKNLNVPIVALSQLSRATEKRDSRIPVLSDLRDSGSIEQDADVVIFAFRPIYYNMKEDEAGNDLSKVAKLIVAKYRNSSLGSIIFDFVEDYMQFKDPENEQF